VVNPFLIETVIKIKIVGNDHDSFRRKHV